MSSDYMLAIIFAVVMSIIIAVVVYFQVIRPRRMREEVSKKWFINIQEMIGSAVGSGDLQAISKHELLLYEMKKYGFVLQEISVSDETHLKRIFATAYSRGIAKLKSIDPENPELNMMKESLARFEKSGS